MSKPSAGSGRPAVAVLAAVLAVPAAPVGAPARVGAPAAGFAACRVPPKPATPIAELPWAQRWFTPERLWPLSRGSGIVVAVVDSGVDTTHPQLRAGQVRPGLDMLTGGAGTLDCDGHGTAVASIIAASTTRDIGFAGLAPRAQILPVRVVEQGTGGADPQQEPPIAPTSFASAVRWAADHEARVINVSIVFYQHHPSIEDAVRYAQGKGAVVVAAVGNNHTGTGPDATPYPAAYTNVVGVGAIGPDGGRVPSSYVGRYVDLVAPGGEVTTAEPAVGHRQRTGTSFAAPFVSATLALLLAAEPNLSPGGAVRRLVATADPAAGPPEEYGHGVVNPYRALAERLSTQAPRSAAPLPEMPADPAAAQRADRARRAAARSARLATGAAGTGLLVLLVALVWARGRRNRWAPTRRPESTAESTVDDPVQLFFTVPTDR